MMTSSNIHKIISFLFSKRCNLCGVFNEQNNLCFECFSSLKYLTISCKKCQQPLNYIGKDINICQRCIDKQYDFFDEMIVPLVYNSFLKKYIIMLKNQNAYYLSDVFSRILYNKVREKLSENFIIAPVPLYSSKLFKRGYNQSLLLAKSFSKIANMFCINDLFLRTRDTHTQANKTFIQRIENVKDAFIFNKKHKNFIKNKKIFIIDDVITTGATIFECAKTLLDIPNQGVVLLAIGKAVKFS